MNKNQDQELDYRMDPVSENVSDARLSQIFGEALGDEPSKEETLAAWDAFEKKHLSSEEESIVKNEKKVSKARILIWITASVAERQASSFLFSVHPRRFLSLRSSPWNFSQRSLLPSRWSRP